MAARIVGQPSDMRSAAFWICSQPDEMERNVGLAHRLEGGPKGLCVDFRIVNAAILAIRKYQRRFPPLYFSELSGSPVQRAIEIGIAAAAELDRLLGAHTGAAPIHQRVHRVVESGKSEAILLAKIRHKAVYGFDQECNLTGHAAATIDDEKNVVRSLRRRERLHLLTPAILINFKIVFSQIHHWEARRIKDGHVDEDHRDVHSER